MSGLVFRLSDLLEHLVMMGRNSRWPTKANHGARPNSSVMRRMRKIGFYHRPGSDSTQGVEGGSDDDELYADEEGGEEVKEEAAGEGKEVAKEGGEQKAGKTDAKAGKTDAKVDKEEEKEKPQGKAGKGKK